MFKNLLVPLDGSNLNVSQIAQKVMQRGVTSILLVPARQKYGPDEEIGYRRIFLPLDGSRRAECVLPVARILAEEEQSELLLAHVTARPVLFSRMPATAPERAALAWLIDHNRTRASDYFYELAARITHGFQTALPVSDNIALALHELMTEEAVDLVLLSAHGRAAQSQWSYGSVTANFIANGSVPLLIVQDMPQSLSQLPEVATQRRRALHGPPQATSSFNSRRGPLSSST